MPSPLTLSPREAASLHRRLTADERDLEDLREELEIVTDLGDVEAINEISAEIALAETVLEHDPYAIARRRFAAELRRGARAIRPRLALSAARTPVRVAPTARAPRRTRRRCATRRTSRGSPSSEPPPCKSRRARP